MRRLLACLTVASIVCISLPAPVRAVTCEETIADRFARFAQTRMKVVQRCRELVLTGRISGPCPDDKTVLQIEKARAKLRQLVNQRCGGADATCGAGGDDADLATIGWNVGQCRNLHAASCANTIVHCGDVADCLVCVGEAAVDQTISLAYDSLEPAPPEYDVTRCQATIGRSVARYFEVSSGALQRCELRDLGDPAPEPCPDPAKAAPRIARAEEKLIDRICRSCGSSADGCSGNTVPIAWVGFPAVCPAVAVPGGASCAQPVQTLTDLIECVRCVASFHVDCLDPLSVPTLKGYPPECPAP